MHEVPGRGAHLPEAGIGALPAGLQEGEQVGRLAGPGHAGQAGRPGGQPGAQQVAERAQLG
jgi:hypothetical protein